MSDSPWRFSRDTRLPLDVITPRATRLFRARNLETGEEAIIASTVSRRPLGAIFSFARGGWTYVASHRGRMASERARLR